MRKQLMKSNHVGCKNPVTENIEWVHDRINSNFWYFKTGQKEGEAQEMAKIILQFKNIMRILNSRDANLME